MEKKTKRLQLFLEELGKISKKYNLCIDWTDDGMEIREIESGDGDPEYLGYSCITQDRGFKDPTLIATHLIYDD